MRRGCPTRDRGSAPTRRRSAAPLPPSCTIMRALMGKMWRVYSGADGESHIAELPLDLKPFRDVEGAHGETTPLQAVGGIAFRLAPPGLMLDRHRAPPRPHPSPLS